MTDATARNTSASWHTLARAGRFLGMPLLLAASLAATIAVHPDFGSYEIQSLALGALPLALGSGEGAEMRRPLGIAIVGGLLVSQLLTLYTTPVVYLYIDRLQNALAQWPERWWRMRKIPKNVPQGALRPESGSL